MTGKKKYRLQPVLDVRDRAKQEAARLVAARRLQVEQAEGELMRREREVTACLERQAAAQEQMLAEARSGTEARHMVAHRTHLADLRTLEEELRARVEQQKLVVARARQDLDNALAALIEASREVQVIEKHRDDWRQRTRLAEQRREQKLSDEIASIMHGRGRKDE
jgi:flagellar export protein FliJ